MRIHPRMDGQGGCSEAQLAVRTRDEEAYKTQTTRRARQMLSWRGRFKRCESSATCGFASQMVRAVCNCLVELVLKRCLFGP
jgi:hypothetical protein